MDIDHLQEWVGRTDIAEDIITPELVRRFRATLDLADEDCKIGDRAPRLIHFCLAPASAPSSRLGPDGHPPRGSLLPPVPLPRRMWAGGALEFTGDLAIGDYVRRTSRVAGITLKQGKSGPLCFVTITHTIEAGGMVRVSERQDIVYRGADAGQPRAEAEPVIGLDPRGVVVTAPVLFRYSALTFNGHRIHYDRRYAIEEEAYPGLVVQGPLQATMLLHYVAALRGRDPDRFSFRSQSPLFDEDIVELQSAGDENRLVAWTSRRGGPIAMRAEAEWE